MPRLLALATSLLFAVSVSGSEPPTQLADLLGNDADPRFARALSPREFTFPADHGPHPEYRNEWWYVTGNLDSDSGRRFGFELTFFRFALAPGEPSSGSAWRTRVTNSRVTSPPPMVTPPNSKCAPLARVTSTSSRVYSLAEAMA